MAKLGINIKKMTEKQAKELLEKIVDQLNEMDEEDYFGTEGWKHRFGLEY